jgi:hypothetical protein
MTIEKFAEKYGLKTRTDEDGTTIIPGKKHRLFVGKWKGKLGSSLNHIYEHDKGVLAVMIGFDGRNRAAMWEARKVMWRNAGMEMLQDGDWEGSAIFDPENGRQRTLAIKTAGVKPKRVMSERQAEVLRQARKLLRPLGQKDGGDAE